MESNGGDASTILRELENLKSSKIEIEHRISVLEAQLRQKKDETKVNSTSSCTPVSNGSDSDVGLGLSPKLIYRYSHHLLLPSIGVQGMTKTHMFKQNM
ncbi:Adenylyltransferase and sulfurtransferase MOCS3 [Camellia lanceoleosa]|uniref:Adenylyltransferase and sulfurtransferase MOCS3 n=1 Tax=Camellia lanceoleosa TaxID=1840588 RepID=A0ACC0FHH4_9ERIC|nr:Adenylyltransferase and sulfurtransferase MOCS3 [Camellia lanceoleosa]